MEENNSKKKTNILLVILIILVIVALVLVKHSIDNLIGTIADYQITVNDSQNNYNDDNVNWEDRIDQLEKTIKKQANAIDDAKITFKNCNAQNKTVDMNFSIIPKEYSTNTTAEVTFGKYKQQLKQKNGKFQGSVTVPYDQIFSKFQFGFKTNDTIKNAILKADEDEDFVNWDEIIYENIYCEYEGDSSEDISDNKVKLKMNGLKCTIDESEANGSIPQICISKDGKVVYSCDMKADGENNTYSGSVNTTVDLIENATYKCFIKYIGKSGLEYRYYCQIYKCNKKEKYVDSTYSEATCVYGTDGKEIEFNYVDEE